MKIGSLEISTKIFVWTVIAYGIADVLVYITNTDKSGIFLFLLIPVGVGVGRIGRNEMRARSSIVLSALVTSFISLWPLSSFSSSSSFLGSLIYLFALYVIPALIAQSTDRRFHLGWLIAILFCLLISSYFIISIINSIINHYI